MNPSTLRRARTPRSLAIASVLTVGGVAAAFLAFGTPAAASAGPAVASPLAQLATAATCPPVDEMPGIGNGETPWTDNNVSTFAGGSIFVRGTAAELEGVVVATENFDLAKTAGGAFNVGVVGVGSQITPAPDSVMLHVGNDLVVATAHSLLVGVRAGFAGGGAVNVGGSITMAGSSLIDSNGAAQTESMGTSDALAPWGSFASTIASTSASLAAATSTGTVETESWGEGRFIGDGVSARQVFELDGATFGAVKEFHFSGIPSGASVVVNVTGASATVAPNYYSLNGVPANDMAAAPFATVASSVLWNFPTATSVKVQGSSQVAGSFLVPSSESELSATASLNGRVYVGGDITIEGVGNEFHSYPWIGDEVTSCSGEPEPEIPVEPGTTSDGDSTGTTGGSTGTEGGTTGTEGGATGTTTGTEGTEGGSTTTATTATTAGTTGTTASEKGGLASTGTASALPLTLGAIVLLLLGGGLFFARRRAAANA